MGVVDDHELVRDGICAVLDSYADIETVAVAGTVADGINECLRSGPDVLIVDFHLPDGHGPEIVSAVRPQLPDLAALVITGTDERRAVESAVSHGCAGFVAKGVSSTALIRAVRSLGQGAAVFPAELLAAVTRDDRADIGAAMTDREREVLSLLADARSASEIADSLHVSLHTARNHIRSVLSKLHATSQLEAVVIAARAGLISIG